MWKEGRVWLRKGGRMKRGRQAAGKAIEGEK